jgi:hypothetical protein
VKDHASFGAQSLRCDQVVHFVVDDDLTIGECGRAVGMPRVGEQTDDGDAVDVSELGNQIDGGDSGSAAHSVMARVHFNVDL